MSQTGDYSIFSILGEIHYIEKGYKITAMGTRVGDNPQGYDDTGPITRAFKFSYLSRPILLEMNIYFILPYKSPFERCTK